VLKLFDSSARTEESICFFLDIHCCDAATEWLSCHRFVQLFTSPLFPAAIYVTWKSCL